MKRTWTIIGVGDVARSFKWYQSLFGQPETAPAHDYFGQIRDSDGTVLLWTNSGYVVPRRAFADEWEFAQFVEAAQSYHRHDLATGPDPAPAPPPFDEDANRFYRRAALYQLVCDFQPRVAHKAQGP